MRKCRFTCLECKNLIKLGNPMYVNFPCDKCRSPYKIETVTNLFIQIVRVETGEIVRVYEQGSDFIEIRPSLEKYN